MLIIEILPIPLTSLISLFVIRRRPDWLPRVVDRLYVEKDVNWDVNNSDDVEKLAGSTRTRCTLVISIMILFDFLIPLTIFTGLITVRRRPDWFINTVYRLYADKISAGQNENQYAVKSTDSQKRQILEKKYSQLHKNNNDYILNIGNKKK